MSGLKLQDALLFLGVAALLVPLLRQLRIHAILGFLIAGVLLGPYSLAPLVIQDVEGAAALAELGVVLLLFLIGLEISWERLWSMRRWIFGMGTLQWLVCGAIIGGFALAFGNSSSASLVLGGCLALSSTAIVMQMINEQRALGSPLGQASFSILLLQDLAVVPLLLLVGLLGIKPEGSLWLPVAIAIGKALLAIILIFILGRLLLRPLFRWVAGSGRSEAFMALVLLVAIGTAALTEHFGLSLALGSFLAGLLLAETQYRQEIEVRLEPFNGMLMGLFFMSVGMNIDVAYLMKDSFWLIASVIGLMLIKAVVITGLLRINHFDWGHSLRGGLLLSQAGEFGFIVVSMAMGYHLLNHETGQFMLLVVSSSMFLTPLANELGLWIQVKLEQHRHNGKPEQQINLPQDRHVLVAGCGRVGELVTRVLSSEQLPWIAIEKSADRVEVLRQRGFPVIYGDVTHGNLLHKLHADKACAVVVTVDEPRASERTVTAIRARFPDTPIYARARDSEHASRLLKCGATAVIPDAVEAGLQLSALALRGVGVPEDACQVIVAGHRERELLLEK